MIVTELHIVVEFRIVDTQQKNSQILLFTSQHGWCSSEICFHCGVFFGFCSACSLGLYFFHQLHRDLPRIAAVKERRYSNPYDPCDQYIFLYINSIQELFFGVNVGNYSIHGCYVSYGMFWSYTTSFRLNQDCCRKRKSCKK